MQLSHVFGQARVILVTLLIGLAVAGLTTLTAHYAYQASQTSAENEDLRQQVRDLVTRLAELETLIGDVSRERQAVEDVTLATLGTVLDQATIDRERNGPLYVATLSSKDRIQALEPKVEPGPPVSAAQMATLIDRTARLRENATSLIRDLRTTSQVVDRRHAVLAAIPSRLPADGWISSSYGVRNSPFHSGEVMHNGLDIAADEGTPVFAPADGEVVFAGVFGGFGKYVRISHGYGIGTRYAHNAEILVKKGQKVRRGDQIAVIGSTGRSTGPHLHYEVLVHGEQIDPSRFVLDQNIKRPTELVAASVPPHPLGVGGEAIEANASSLTTSTHSLSERLFQTAADGSTTTGPLDQTTTRDMIMLVGTLLLMAIAGSLVKLPATVPVPAADHPMTRETPTKITRRANRGVWTRPSTDDEWA